MKMAVRAFLFVSLFLNLPVFADQPDVAWNAYDATLHPTAAESITLADGTKSQFTMSSSTDPNLLTVVNGIAYLDTTANISLGSLFRYNDVIDNSGKYPKRLTLLVRATGTDEAIPRVLDLDLNLADEGKSGARIFVGIGHNNVFLAEVDGTNTVTANTPVNTVGTHIYQINIDLKSPKHGQIKVYMDGNEAPIIDHHEKSLRQTSSPGTNSLRFGENSTRTMMKGAIDWIIWTTEKDYQPHKLVGKLPTHLNPSPGYLTWNVYDASLHPLTAESVTQADGSKSAFSFQASTQPDITSSSELLTVENGIAYLDTTALPSYGSLFRYENIVDNTGLYPKTFTVAARVTGSAGEPIPRILEIDLNMADEIATGPRPVLSIRSDRLVLNSNDTRSTTVLMNNEGTHIYQMSVTLTSPTQGSVKVYKDGSSTPVIDRVETAFRQSSTAGANHLRFGENSATTTMKGAIDWMIWTEAGAYTPTELVGQYPAELDLSVDLQ